LGLLLLVVVVVVLLLLPPVGCVRIHLPFGVEFVFLVSGGEERGGGQRSWDG
jgi:hypothetical protein